MNRHKAKSVKRGIMLADNRKSVVIRDEIALGGINNEVYWFMHVKDGDINITDNNTAYITVNNKTVKFSVITNAKEYELKVMKAEPLSTSPKTLAQEKTYDEFKKIAIKINCNETLNITVKIQPETSDIVFEPINGTPLEQWGK